MWRRGRLRSGAAAAASHPIGRFAGIRALAVYAKNEAARSFCERFDFEPSPTDRLHLFALIKDLKSL